MLRQANSRTSGGGGLAAGGPVSRSRARPLSRICNRRPALRSSRSAGAKAAGGVQKANNARASNAATGPVPKAPQMGREASRKRGVEVEEKSSGKKRERQESCEDGGSSTASTVGGENDSSSSVGHQSDSDLPPRGAQCDDEASEAACSLANIMMSIQAQTGSRPNKSQPISAPSRIESGPKSGRSSISGDDNDDDHSGDSTLIKKQRRREKNRASAQQSRQRKKFHLEALEVHVDELERERAALMAQVEALSAENRRLRAAGGGGDTATLVKAEELAGVGLLSQLAQVAHKLRSVS